MNKTQSKQMVVFWGLETNVHNQCVTTEQREGKCSEQQYNIKINLQIIIVLFDFFKSTVSCFVKVILLLLIEQSCHFTAGIWTPLPRRSHLSNNPFCVSISLRKKSKFFIIFATNNSQRITQKPLGDFKVMFPIGVPFIVANGLVKNPN